MKHQGNKTHVISSVIVHFDGSKSDPDWGEERVTKAEAYRACEVLNRKYGANHIWTPALITGQTLNGKPIATPDKVCLLTGMEEARK